jgi:hypothetical protein
MKVDMTASAMKSHTVTVPREYLEGLEQFYRTQMENHYNMRGDVRRVMTPPTHLPVPTEKKILFINDGDIVVDEIIILDSEGRERILFTKKLDVTY